HTLPFKSTAIPLCSGDEICLILTPAGNDIGIAVPIACVGLVPAPSEATPPPMEYAELSADLIKKTWYSPGQTIVVGVWPSAPGINTKNTSSKESRGTFMVRILIGYWKQKNSRLISTKSIPKAVRLALD